MLKNVLKRVDEIILWVFVLLSAWLMCHYIFFSIGETRYFKSLDNQSRRELISSRKAFETSLKIFPGNKKAESYIKNIDLVLDPVPLGKTGSKISVSESE